MRAGRTMAGRGDIDILSTQLGDAIDALEDAVAAMSSKRGDAKAAAVRQAEKRLKDVHSCCETYKLELRGLANEDYDQFRTVRGSPRGGRRRGALTRRRRSWTTTCIAWPAWRRR